MSPIRYGNKEIARILLGRIEASEDISPKDKEIFILRFLEDWRYDEIARYVGIKYRGSPYIEGVVRYRLKKVLEKVHEMV